MLSALDLSCSADSPEYDFAAIAGDPVRPDSANTYEVTIEKEPLFLSFRKDKYDIQYRQGNIEYITFINDMNLSERISSLVEYSGKNLSEFSRYVGFKTPQTVRELIKGNTKSLSFTASEKIRRAFPEINPDWLMTGDGEMLREGATSPKPSPTIDETSKEMERLQLENGRLKDELLASQRKNIELLEEVNRLKSASHPGLCPLTLQS